MNTLVLLLAGLSVALGRPHYYTVPYPYYTAIAPTTYQYQLVDDVAKVHTLPVVHQPLVYTAPVPVHYQSQYHSQDELGQYSFGHASPSQAHSEVRDFTGAVRGAYKYINAEGEEVYAHYIADHNGFRVSSNALPEGPEAHLEAPVMTLEQIADTPEVEAAKKEHFRLVEEHKAVVAAALAAAEEEATAEEEPAAEEPVAEEPAAEEPATEERVAEEPTTEEPATEEPAAEEEHHAVEEDHAAEGDHAAEEHHRRRRQAIFYTASHPVPVVEPAVEDAELLRIVHNPGHSTSYRVL